MKKELLVTCEGPEVADGSVPLDVLLPLLKGVQDAICLMATDPIRPACLPGVIIYVCAPAAGLTGTSRTATDVDSASRGARAHVERRQTNCTPMFGRKWTQF